MRKLAESTDRRARPPGRPRADEGRDTRGDLLRVARELFAAKGYAGASVAEIGARADVTVPVIYQRFGSKAGLFVAVADDVYAYGATRLRAGLAAADSFDAALAAALRDFAGLYDEDPTLAAMVVTVLVEAERDDKLGRALKPSLRKLREYCDDLARFAPADLAANDAERLDLSRALVSVLSGLMVSSVLLNRAADYERMVGAVGKLLRVRERAR
ncbi:TetR/AcrR family transcriptional regulator [Skermania sp. ID1734]|uniref:TetR/AcrR family transcriptional regulator n=1 Tax=Skermania sp. ID1734 TaxID=2597516 RepID=UPI00117EDD50|nr:TetR/AcrR family transcriptional regulator [Skermania sp. ID1734]TSE01490.1 TetR/AcrR family transcriptional regulator [Skermania sp. ID1734]